MSQQVEETIQKQKQRSSYLTGVLQELQEKLYKVKEPKSADGNSLDEVARVQAAQVKNIDKRIQIYKTELEKMGETTVDSVVTEVQRLRQAIRDKQNAIVKLKQQYKALQIETNKMKDQHVSQAKNKKMEISFSERTYEVELLKKKLKKLDAIQGQTVDKIPTKPKGSKSFRSHRSMSLTQTQDHGKADKRKKVDQYALYKNLIKFYEQEQTKIKTEIEDLEKKKSEREEVEESVTREIEEYEQKIDALKRPKLKWM